MKAYDEYLDLKAKIFNPTGGYDWRFLLMSQELQIGLFNEYRKAEGVAKELHYARNQFNVALPKSEEEAKKWGWKKLPYLQSQYHQYGVSKGNENTKWISPYDGHREVVFSFKDGSIDNSIENQGTYNFFDPTWEPNSHWKYDVQPWKEWGSGYGDLNFINY